VTDRSLDQQTTPRVAGARDRARPGSAPPPRPAVSGHAVFPAGVLSAGSAGARAGSAGIAASARPRTLQLSIGLWFAASLAGLFGVGAALSDMDALRDRLAEAARTVDATATAGAVDDAVRATILLVFGAVVLLALLTVAGAALVHRRRSWARWMLLGTGLVTLFAVDVAQSTVAGGEDLDRIGLVAQAGLVVLAVVLLFAPPSRRWLRSSSD
jgi:hypothetical protein